MARSKQVNGHACERATYFNHGTEEENSSWASSSWSWRPCGLRVPIEYVSMRSAVESTLPRSNFLSEAQVYGLISMNL